MAYENMSEGALNYYPCRYGKSKLLFRGPRKKLSGEYFAFLGGTETYGKFMEKPFPDLVEQSTGVQCVNFGCVNAGIDVYANEPALNEACSGARVTVVQIMGAQNMSNRFYAVHPRRNDRFLRASGLLKTIFRDVDFTEFNFTRHLLKTLAAISPERFSIVRNELREAWVARMKLLLRQIEGKTVLLWLSEHSPDDPCDETTMKQDPLFVGREMIEEIRPYASDIVEIVAKPRPFPHRADGLVFSPMDAPAAEEMLGVDAHQKVAEALSTALLA